MGKFDERRYAVATRVAAFSLSKRLPVNSNPSRSRRLPRGRQFHASHEEQGQSLVELAIFVPVLFLLMFFVVDFGYYFVVAAALTSSARNATEYASQGFSSPSNAYSSPSKPSPPPAGPISAAGTVAALAAADMKRFAGSGSQLTVQVCSATVGTSGGVTCQTWGATGYTWTPHADPQPGNFQLCRVDVRYTIAPPLPISFLGYSLVPSYNFHRMAEMRAMN